MFYKAKIKKTVYAFISKWIKTKIIRLKTKERLSGLSIPLQKFVLLEYFR